jgi:beta-lactamase class D
MMKTLLAASTIAVVALGARASESSARSCFLLHEIGVGELRRAPDSACAMRVSPQSTFKIPHALAALDAGVVDGPDTTFKYDGHAVDFPVWARDHSLATAMRYSVVWYFQQIAQRLGVMREREYLQKFRFGNADVSGGLTTFWLGRSLLVTPEEELRFLLRLYANDLPVSRRAMDTVRQILVQPAGRVVNATGEHPFDAPWPTGTVVTAKTGGGPDSSGDGVRWLVGYVQRGGRSWVFVTCIVGRDVDPLAALDLAARALREEKVL